MEGLTRHFRLRSAGSTGVALLALIVLLGVGGFFLTSTTIRHDQDAAAERRAQVEAVHAQEVLGRARAYVAGLAEVLAAEPKPGQARFARWASATSASVGLNDVLWVQRVPSTGRARYERLQGFPITRLTGSGDLTRAPPAPSYLPATFTSQSRPELRPGVDVTSFPGLAGAIGDRARIFAVGASRAGALGPETGFYLLEAATFARGAGSSGYLVAFIPRGWFSTSLGGDPRRVAISQDGRRIEGQLGSAQASANFETLGRDWRIDVAREPPSGLQSLLPWLALAWPFAVAAVVLAIGRAVMLRRRAQLEVERIFALSLDLISVIGLDGRFKAVNPAFERTLGYSREAMVGRPYADFVHPDHLEASREAFAAVIGGDEVTQFENRYIRADGSERWLEWSARAMPDEGAVYCIARDVTERRRIDAALRDAQQTAEARGAELEVRAAEETARRRVATLVARQASQAELVSVIADETGRLLGTEVFRVLRFDQDNTAVVLATAGAGGEFFPEGSRHRLGGANAVTRVFETRRPVRIDDYSGASGPIGEGVRAIGLRSVVAAPILVGGRLWGTMLTATTRAEPVPPETEARLGQFTDLMATAIANTQSRAEVERLADEQSALRRVAMVVAGEAPEAAVFTAVAEEIGRLLEVDEIRMLRFEGDKSALVVAGSGDRSDIFPVGLRIPLGGENAATRVFRTGLPARVDDYARATGPIAEKVLPSGLTSVVAAPIVVEGRRWGAIAVGTMGDDPLPPSTESRLAQFTDQMATAVANAESRARADRLADEQAALRRVATLVAERASSTAVFDAVAAEMEALLDADSVILCRYEPGDEVTVVAYRGNDPDLTPPGTRVREGAGGVTATVRRTQRSTRLEGYADVAGPRARRMEAMGVRAVVGAPIVVDGRLWGVVVANWQGEQSSPAGTEARMAQFAELLDTAIANADARDQLDASRARLVTAADDARRRVVRDLHDGAQQRLVHTIVTLKLAQRALVQDDARAVPLVGEALKHAERGNEELRELSHGILPSVLTRGGLQAGVDSLAARLAVPVEVEVPPDRFAEEIEASAYFVVAEALTNVVKHGHAERAEVRASVQDGMLRVEVQDDGIGGADPAGHGLVGMSDRVGALGGWLDIKAPPGGAWCAICTTARSSGSSTRS